MQRSISVAIVVAGLVLALTGCSGEPKPDTKGVFVVVGDQIRELKPVILETEFTDEGFAVQHFTGEPAVTAKLGKFYFILYGDYRAVGLRAFAPRGKRYEEDSSKGDLTSLLSAGGIAGEPEMSKCQVSRELKSGTYALEIQHAGTVLHFPFNVELY